MAVLIKNISYLIRDAGRIEKGRDILIRGNEIFRIGNYREDWLQDGDNLDVVDASGMAVVPGLINAHTHLYQNLVKGCRDDMMLGDWLNEVVFPLCNLINRFKKDKQNESLGYYWSILASMEMLKNGTTTCIDLDMTSNSVFQGWQDIGIRGIGAVTCADRGMPDNLKSSPEKVIKNIIGYVERWHLTPVNNPRIYVMFGPSAPFLCTEPLLHLIREEASRRRLNIHLHISETLSEVELMLKETGCRPVEYLDKIGFLGPDVSAAHCVHVNDSEIKILKENGVVPVHNPKSNMKLGNGVAPVRKMLEEGIEVALGNDGSGSNDNQDLFEDMRTAALLQKVDARDPGVITARDIFRMATEGGARACRINAGTIDEGKLADLVLIDIDKPHLFPMGDPINTLVYCARGSDVDTVLVNGQTVIRNGNLVKMDEAVIFSECKRAIEKSMKL